MREFSYALLGKWCWRMLVARYGEEAGRLGAGVFPVGGGR